MNKQMIAPFYQIMNQFRNLCRSEFPDFDLTQNEVCVMILLVKFPNRDTARQLSDILGMSPALVSRAIESLHKKEIICLKRDEKDRRVYHLSVNAEKPDLVDSLNAMEEKFRRILMEGIDPQEVEIFHRVLVQIIENIHRRAEGE